MNRRITRNFEVRKRMNPFKEMQKNIIKMAKQLKKDGKLTIGVTNVLRIYACPLQAIVYSSRFKVLAKTHSKAFTIGTLCHYVFELFYEMDAETFDALNEREKIELLLERAVLKLKRERLASYSYYITNKDGINAQAFKYIRTFLKWADNQPKPFRRELFVTHGLVVGVVDRIDKFNINGKIFHQLTDYKTASSAPFLSADEIAIVDSGKASVGLLKKYAMQEKYEMQLGGYCFIYQKIFPKISLLPPKISVFRAASWKEHIIMDWQKHVINFEAYLKHAAEIILDILKGKVPEGIDGENCYFCLVNSKCPYYKGYRRF